MTKLLMEVAELFLVVTELMCVCLSYLLCVLSPVDVGRVAMSCCQVVYLV